MQDKFIELQSDSLTSGQPLTDEEIVDEVMNATKRTDYRPGAGYGPRAVGHSTRIGSKQHYREELFASQQKNVELTQDVKMLKDTCAKMEDTCAKMAEEMAQVHSLLTFNIQQFLTFY